MKNVLPLGKLNYSLFESLLKEFGTPSDPRVIVGPGIGQDAAVIEYPDRYLVAKTDPITFATDNIGWYAVNVNANDIATTGATPKWFMATILLPEKKSAEEDITHIFSQIDEAAKALNISVIGGHTEVSYRLDRPIVVVSMLGEVAKSKLVKASGAKPGDVVILTKGIVIEGTSIIAREKYDELLKNGLDGQFLDHCKNFLHKPGLSVVAEALLANEYDVHAMHDPTEGGLTAGLFEIAYAAKVGMLIQKKDIPIFPESVRLCKAFGLNPLQTITSGTLLIVAPKTSSAAILSKLQEHAIRAVVIGEVKDWAFGLKISDSGKVQDLTHSAKDEITKIFK